MNTNEEVPKEELLTESIIDREEHYRILIENSPDVIIRFDKKLKHIFVNQAIYKAIQLKPGDFLNKSHREMGIFPDHLCQLWEDCINSVFKTGISKEIEFNLELERGKKYFEWRLFPEFKKNKEVETVFTIARDITDRKTFDRKLRESRNMIELILRKKQENIQKALFGIANAINTTRNLEELFISIQNTLGKVIDTKNCYVALYDLLTDTITLPFHKDEKDSFTIFPAGKTLTGHVIRTGNALLVNHEKALQMEKDGLIDSIGSPSESWLGVPLKLGKKIIGVFAVQSYDKETIFTEDDVQLLEFVSDQIALAIERKKDQDKLVYNQIRQKRIIESSPDGLIVIDPAGFIFEHNTSILELLNTSSDKLRGKNFFDFISNEDKSKAGQILDQTKNTGYRKNIQLRMVRDDGHMFYAETSLGLICEQENISESYVVIIKSINERKAYETNLKIAKEKAEESGRLKTAFLSNMSHEIRTPMNAIVGFSELLSRKDLLEEEKKEFLSQINLGAETLMHLIDDIIDIAKIESGQLIIHKTRFLLSELFEDLRIVFTKTLDRTGKRSLRIIADHGKYHPDIVVYTDHFRLKQIFTNLISNAIKFTEHGDICFGIRKIEGEFITLYVKDTGIGIEKEKQDLIFERFRQGHDSKTKVYGGTGLGLAISRNLTELLDGKINVQSEPGEGADFYFTLPLVTSIETEIDEKTVFQEITLDLSGKTILIAEDEESNFILLAEALKYTGALVLWARDGFEVVELFKSNPQTDLILMDVRLPLQSGYEATRVIKTLRKDIPVIAQTAYAMAGEKRQSILAGCDDFIPKPIKFTELFFLISKHLKQ